MAENEGKTGRKSGMDIDTALVRELAEMLAETGLSEIEVEDGDRKVRVARGTLPAQSITMAAQPAAPPAAAVEAASPASASPALREVAGGNAMKSPMVGTAYLAADPESANFVKVGDRVEIGDTLLIIEAMKVMNPITAETAGTVQQIMVENAQPVEYDQPLIVIG